MPAMVRRKVPDAEQLWRDARAAFVAAFKRLKNGNLHRRYFNDPQAGLTVFRNARGFAWCVALDMEGVKPRYSDKPFDTEAQALEALASHLGVGNEHLLPNEE